MSGFLRSGILQQGANVNQIDTAIAIINDGNSEIYDFTEISTLTLDANNKVGRWNSFTETGHDLIQATTDNKLLFTASGISSDGINDIMRTAAFTLTQPYKIYLIVDLVENGVSAQTILDGNAVNTGRLIKSGAGGIGMSAGTSLYDSVKDKYYLTVPHGGFVFLKALFNGANSKLEYDDIDSLSGNAGTNNMGGLCIGARPTNNWAKCIYKYILIRKTLDSPENDTIISAYVKKKVA